MEFNKRSAEMKYLLVAIMFVFLSGCTVTYQKHTGIPKCDIAIMLAKIKSQKGNSAFEISRYMEKCYEEMDKQKSKDK